jgi:hypothetical protein
LDVQEELARPAQIAFVWNPRQRRSIPDTGDPEVKLDPMRTQWHHAT